jgi:NhaB family Na+:H+ antiporter
MPDRIRGLRAHDYKKKSRELTGQVLYKYILQGAVALFLILILGFHLIEVGFIGLGVIIFLSACTGMIKEHDFAEPFNNTMPFVTLIVIFFVILAVVYDQKLVSPLVQWVLSFEGQTQLLILYIVNGVLSMVSDSVFVASIFITEVDNAYKAGAFSLEWYQKLAAVVNMGTNIPSLGTPNGTAGFLFLLTSALAPLIKLSYFRMLMIMIPYFIVLSSIGGIMVYFFL